MDIYSIGDGAFLEQVITAVTLVSGSGEFASMAKIGLLFGVILLLFQGITSGGRGINVAQIGVAGLLYALMFGGTQTVTVTDAYTQEVRVIDNVPNGVAATGSFLSSIGFNITELFETAFSTPTMTEQGYGFSLDVLKRVRMHSLTEFHLGVANQAQPGSDFYESWSEYIKTCTIRGIEIGQLSKDDLFRSPDFISALNFDNTFFHAQIQVGATPESLPCSEAYDQLETYTQAFFLPSFKENVLPGVLDLDQPAGAAEVEDVINDALNGLGVGPAPQPVPGALVGQPITADDYITSSVLVPIYYYAIRKYYVQDGKFSYADQLDDSVRARNSQWMANQSLFDRYLRPMLTFVEGFMFAATPILALLIPVGAAGIGAAGRFLLVGAWIQLWMPALAIVNLFIHNVVAGKMAALADAGTPLTSLAGLHQGDDIIQTWLGTGGLMASAVPVLTLMIVYGGAISANFFATRLQGEDVVMERQAAGATFNPYPQMQIDPARTFDRTAGSILLSGAGEKMDTYSWNQSVGLSTESALHASRTANEQFESVLGQSANRAWTEQQSATVGEGRTDRIAVEKGAYESAIQSNFKDLINTMHTQGGMSEADATNYVAGWAFGANVPLPVISRSGLNMSMSDQETETNRVEQMERYEASVRDQIGANSELRASLNESMAADITSNTSDALVSAETFGSDEAVRQSAQDVLSTGESYSETVRAGSSMSADQNVNAKYMIPSIAGNDQARKELYDLAAREGALGEAQQYFDHMGARDQQLFGGNEDHARLYSLTHTLASRLDDGDEAAARAQAGLADVFSTAHGSFGGEIGNAGANQGLVGMNNVGATQELVETRLGSSPAGAAPIEHGIQAQHSMGPNEFREAYDEQRAAVSEHQADHLAAYDKNREAMEEEARNLRDTVKQDRLEGSLEKAGVDDPKRSEGNPDLFGTP